MAEECSYYYYDNGYSCALKREKEGNSTIDSDTVHRYCWGYHYEDCPRYKNRVTSSRPCYLTSACVEAMGLTDNCHELEVLRSFRDGYILSLPNGADEVSEYYCCAPTIVDRIKNQANAKEIFEQIYRELILPCVDLIEKRKYNEAFTKYKQYTYDLQRI